MRRRKRMKILNFVLLNLKLTKNTPPREAQPPTWRTTTNKSKDYRKEDDKSKKKKKQYKI